MKKIGAKEWYNENEKWVWRGGLAAAWIASLWLSSNFISREIYWKNYREQATEIRDLRERACKVETKLGIKHKKNKLEPEDDE